jgi:thioredoxin-like negative regulator of GroEL
MLSAEDTSAQIGEVAAPPPALPKHRYPKAIVAAGVLTLVAAAYSFYSAPPLISAAHHLRAGQTALAQGQLSTADVELRRAHAAVPTSHKITVALAEAEFANGEDAEAMELLRGVKLDSGEWTALQRYMPARLQSYFEPTS